MNHLLNCLAERWQTASLEAGGSETGNQNETTIMLIALVCAMARSLAVRQLKAPRQAAVESSLLLGMMQAPQWLPTEAYDAN